MTKNFLPRVALAMAVFTGACLATTLPSRAQDDDEPATKQTAAAKEMAAKEMAAKESA
jgi:hypothetical protein